MSKFSLGQSVAWTSECYHEDGTVRTVRFPALIVGVNGSRYQISPDCGDPNCVRVGNGCLYSPGDEWVDADALDGLNQIEAVMTASERTYALESSMGRG